MATKLGFQLESSLASKHLTDATYIKGGYLTVNTINERDNLPIYDETTSPVTDGIIVNGSLCYVTSENKFYKFNGSSWVEEFQPTTYTAGDGISISENTIATKYDNKTINLDTDGNLQTAIGGYTEGNPVTLINGGYTQENPNKWVSENTITAENWATYFEGKESINITLNGLVTIDDVVHTLNGIYTFTSTEGGNAFQSTIDESSYTNIICWGPTGEGGTETAYKVMFKGNNTLSNISLTATIETIHTIQNKYIPQDNTPTLNSNNFVTSNGIYNSLQQNLVTSQKKILLGANGTIENNIANFVVDNPSEYLYYRTNLTRFMLDLSLPVTGTLTLTDKITITFGDTTYSLYRNGNEVTLGDLKQVTTYNTSNGYRFIFDSTLFITSDISGFVIIPTINTNDILSLTNDEMDNYLADGGLVNGQLAICYNVSTNGYEVGGIYKFNYGQTAGTYEWVEINKTTNKILMTYDGEIITLNGTTQTFESIKTRVDNTNNIVMIDDQVNHLMMRYTAYEENAIWFESNYKISNAWYFNRLIINDENSIIYDNDELEQTSNKTTTISSTSTDIQYPSAKAVYTKLQNKQDTITEDNKLSNSLVSGLGTASTKDVGTASGNVVEVGTDGKIASSIIPASAITDTFVVNSQSSMLALNAQVGDVAVRTDLNKSFILKATPATTLANWQELLTPTDAVTSVNGQTGAVNLSASDVGALSSSTPYVSSVNGSSGAITGLATTEEIENGDVTAMYSEYANQTQHSLTIKQNGTTQTFNGSSDVEVTISGGGITNHEVIDTEASLPTATETSADFVQVSGELYFKKVEEVEQLATPTNITASGTTISFDPVENATSYEVYADGVSIGTYTPA